MATLTIDVDDQATDAMANIEAALDETAKASETAAKGADVLT